MGKATDAPVITEEVVETACQRITEWDGWHRVLTLNAVRKASKNLLLSVTKTTL